MAAEIIIQTDKGTLDLYQGAEDVFYITRQIHDLHNFQTRNADFSKNLEVPPTPNNLSMLGVEQNSPDDQGTQCSITMGGVMIAPVAFLYFVGTEIVNNETLLRIQILFGNFNFINSILGTLNELNWADVPIEYDVPTAITLSQSTQGVCMPIAQWAARGSRGISDQTIVDINQQGFMIYVDEIMRRIILEAGFTLAKDADLPTDYNVTALACPMTRFLSVSDVSQLSLSEVVENDAPQQVSNVAARVVFQIFDPSIWDDANNQWDITTTEDYVLEFAGNITHIETGVRPVSILRIIRNNTNIGQLTFDGNFTDQPFFLSVSQTLVAGDLVFLEIESFATQTILQVESGSTFKISTIGSDLSRTVQVSEFIPQMDQKTFFTGILNMFNLVMITNDISRTVTLRRFNNVFETEEQDLSTIIDTGGSKIEIVPGLSSIGKNSNFTWENDNLLRDDFNLTIRFENDILSPEKTVIALPFSAADSSAAFFTIDSIEPKVRIPMYTDEEESFQISPNPGEGIKLVTINLITGDFTIDTDLAFQIGDYIRWASTNDSYRVIGKNSDRSGTIQPPVLFLVPDVSLELHSTFTPESPEARLAITHIDGDESSLLCTQGRLGDASFYTNYDVNSRTASWFDRLKWENLAADYYDKILNALLTPQVIKASFNLSVFDFIQLDHLRPVYIAQFNAFFYINKINQFKLNNITQIELVRISTLTSEAILGAFDEGFNEGFET